MLKKISEAPTTIDHDNPAAVKAERRNWYIAVDDKGNQSAITNPVTWHYEQRRPGIWYAIRPQPITISEAMERVRGWQRAQNEQG